MSIFRAVNKRISQSPWLCERNIASVTHDNNINNDGWQNVICVSRHQATNETQIIKKTKNNDLKNNIRQQKSLSAIPKYDQNREPVVLQIQEESPFQTFFL